MKALISALLLTLPFITSAVTPPPQAPLPTVGSVDLTKYVGNWFEIAAMPQNFEQACVSDIKAAYMALPNGNIQVENSCALVDNSLMSVTGEALVVDSTTNAKLKVSFVKVGDKYDFTNAGDYWIIYLHPNYEYAVVGHPNRTAGWILSRTPTLPVPVLQDLGTFLKDQGYDPCQFTLKPQSSIQPLNPTLCNLQMAR